MATPQMEKARLATDDNIGTGLIIMVFPPRLPVNTWKIGHPFSNCRTFWGFLGFAHSGQGTIIFLRLYGLSRRVYVNRGLTVKIFKFKSCQSAAMENTCAESDRQWPMF
jgi:hypothetical protein